MQVKQSIVLNKDRYRLYREHKYIFYVFTELLKLTSSLDFSINDDVLKLKNAVKNLSLLLQSHAEYEESRIHFILKNKNSPLFHEAEVQHQHQKDDLENIEKKISLIENILIKEERYFLGYEIYLDLRNFFAENLVHFDYEEKIITPELQQLISDEEIKEIDRISYRQMLPEQMIHMMEVLFPHMNGDDRFCFLDDIKNCEPQKFELAWNGISPMLEENVKTHLKILLNISESENKLENNVKLFYPWETSVDEHSVLMTNYHKDKK